MGNQKIQKLLTGRMTDQIDIAVDLGAVPPPLPEICFLEEFAASPPVAPPQIIEGVLHQGCKMILGGTSKSNKSWCLNILLTTNLTYCGLILCWRI
jgi:hypothetical protein